MKLDSAADTASIAAPNSSANCTVRRALNERNGRIALIVRHGHRRGRRAETNLDTEVALGGTDGLLELAAGRAQIRVPQGQPRRRVGRVGKGGDALGIGASGPGAVGDND